MSVCHFLLYLKKYNDYGIDVQDIELTFYFSDLNQGGQHMYSKIVFVHKPFLKETQYKFLMLNISKTLEEELNCFVFVIMIMKIALLVL